MDTRQHIRIVLFLSLLMSMNACGMFGDKSAHDPNRKYLSCRAQIVEQNGNKGMLVIIENSDDNAFNVEWVIDSAANLAIKKGNIIVNQKSTETYFHEALDNEKTVSGEVRLVRFTPTEDKVVQTF